MSCLTTPVVLFCCGLSLAALQSLAEPAPILIEYRDKPPLMHTVQQRPAGILLDKTRAIMERARIHASFQEVPLKRIVKNIQSNEQRLCSPGWYKLPERERFARFSLPMHQDRPHVVLSAPAMRSAVQAHANLRALLADARLKLSVVSGVSYGPELDALIAASAQVPMQVSVTPLQLARMVLAGRADYMFLDEDDLRYFQQQGELSAEAAGLSLSDMPAGLQRHLMCSMAVEPASLARINQAIRELGYASPERH